jgi:hypothetical protein
MNHPGSKTGITYVQQDIRDKERACVEDIIV